MTIKKCLLNRNSIMIISGAIRGRLVRNYLFGNKIYLKGNKVLIRIIKGKVVWILDKENIKNNQNFSTLNPTSI